jgi:L-alanine-DL-glutamate epimerase-like enolase superfamily enzyme
MITKVETSIKEVHLRETFVTALRSVSEFPVFQVAITDEKNRTGIGECVATPAIVGDDFARFNEIFDSAIRGLLFTNKIEDVQSLNVWPSLKSAVDCAYRDLTAAHNSVSVKTDVTVPIASMEELPVIVKNRLSAGFSTLKVKLGKEDSKSNFKKIVAINNAAEGKAIIRIDPNQAWTVEETLTFIREIEKSDFSLEYIEQPLPAKDLAGMSEIHRASSIKIMADESCFTLDDAKRLIDDQICDYINIKLLKAGGITQAELIARECIDASMNISVGSMMESGEGVRASINFAHQFAPETTHDLDAAWWIKDCSLNYENGRVWS